MKPYIIAIVAALLFVLAGCPKNDVETGGSGKTDAPITAPTNGEPTDNGGQTTDGAEPDDAGEEGSEDDDGADATATE